MNECVLDISSDKYVHTATRDKLITEIGLR